MSRIAMTTIPIRAGARRSSGLTLVEVLMSMLVAGIGLLAVVALFPLAYVRAVQATNLTNGTILRFNAEQQINLSTGRQASLATWQGGQTYQAGDELSLAGSGYPNFWMQCTGAGISSATTPTWNTSLGPPANTTTDGTVTWTVHDVNEINLSYVYPTWQAGTMYQPGSVVLAPSGATGNNCRFWLNPSSPGPGPAPYVSGAAPTWNTTLPSPATPAGTTADNNITWTTVDHSHYVIDPLGWNVMSGTAATSGLKGTLGNNQSPPGTFTAGTFGDIPSQQIGSAIERFNGGVWSGVAAAAQLVTLPDSWVQQSRGPVSGSTSTSVTASGSDWSSVGYSAVWQATTNYAAGAMVLPSPSNGDVYVCTTAGTSGATQPIWSTSVPGTTTDGTVTWTNSTMVPTVSRAVLIDNTGKNSQTRLIANINTTNSTIGWLSTDPLPSSFQPAQIRVETQEQRYTWMLTVLRSSSGIGTVYVTIFFKRSPGAIDEQTYAANGNDGVVTPFAVNYSGQKPFVKKGGFMFDVSFGRWYRITDIVSDNGSQMQILVDRPRSTTDLLSVGGNQNFYVAFMRGVVDVFPLIPK